jgi:signal transduction histidine kinase
VLINLLSNAIKYTQKGSATIQAAFDTESQTCKLSVIDTGVGIEEEKLKDLFCAFNKNMRFRNLNREGVGLGLVISKKLTEALGGTIEVQSKVSEES